MLESIRGTILDSVKDTCLKDCVDEYSSVLVAGKMLRAKLIMAVGTVATVEPARLISASAAVELMHSASLLHDDVIDGGLVRRDAPAFWAREGMPGAVLLGDLLVCCSLKLIDDPHLMARLVAVSAEMCDAEVEQELLAGDDVSAWSSCLDLARRKSGSLFSFVGPVCAKGDVNLELALVGAGYAIGTAYQLADDIFDVYGDQGGSDKSLGTDAIRGKVTAGSLWNKADIDPVVYINDLCQSALSGLDRWKHFREALESYLNSDIFPAIDIFLGGYRSVLDAGRADGKKDSTGVSRSKYGYDLNT